MVWPHPPQECSSAYELPPISPPIDALSMGRVASWMWIKQDLDTIAKSRTHALPLPTTVVIFISRSPPPSNPLYSGVLILIVISSWTLVETYDIINSSHISTPSKTVLYLILTNIRMSLTSLLWHQGWQRNIKFRINQTSCQMQMMLPQHPNLWNYSPWQPSTGFPKPLAYRWRTYPVSMGLS